MFCAATCAARCMASSNSAAYSPCISWPKARRFSAGSAAFFSACFPSPVSPSLIPGSPFEERLSPVGERWRVSRRSGESPASAPPSADGAGERVPSPDCELRGFAAFAALPGWLRFAMRSCAGRSAGAWMPAAAPALSPAPEAAAPSANRCKSKLPNGLRLPASASALALALHPAGRGPNSSSLFLPQAVVVAVAANNCKSTLSVSFACRFTSRTFSGYCWASSISPSVTSSNFACVSKLCAACTRRTLSPSGSRVAVPPSTLYASVCIRQLTAAHTMSCPFGAKPACPDACRIMSCSFSS